MNWLAEMLAPLAGVFAIYRLGFIPSDREFFEMTSEQYQQYYDTVDGAAENYGQKIYMVLPDDPQRCAESASDVVFALSEQDRVAVKSGADVINRYCANSGKSFNSIDDKLRYCAALLPSDVSKGTKYERYNGETPLLTSYEDTKPQTR